LFVARVVDFFRPYHTTGDIIMLRSFFAKEEGQGLVEYALILVLIAIVVIGILTLLGGQVSQVFSNVSSGLQ
jgi:pilus assembly protein Flp/PilA